MAFDDLVFGVTDFVNIFNQTMDTAYPEVLIEGEVKNFKISRNKWLYFDLVDEESSLRCFGSVYSLNTPLEDGMMLRVRGQPRLNHLFGFSLNVVSVRPIGEGSLKKAAELLTQKLTKEGLFDLSRKRSLEYPPEKIGLITSSQSAAYADFIKVINARWSGLMIELEDVQVQGEAAPAQIVQAINQFNSTVNPPDVLVIIRGGGSADDLMAFSTEEVTRAVASSRIPTLVAIGHEIDLSLAELAADKRASTPSNAAELLTPDKKDYLAQLALLQDDLNRLYWQYLKKANQALNAQAALINQNIKRLINLHQQNLQTQASLVEALNPNNILKRGYSIISDSRGKTIKSSSEVSLNSLLQARLYQGEITVLVKHIKGE